MRAVLLLVVLAGEVTCDLVRKNYFVNQYTTWSDAQKYCRTYYEDLSTVNAAWELLKFKRDTQDYLSEDGWVGLSKNTGAMVYTYWSDGSILGAPWWKFGYPNQISHGCVSINNLELVDSKCEENKPFFCYQWAPSMVLVKMMMTWEEALQYCRTHYTDLISVTSDNDLASATSTSMNSTTSSVWTGFRFMDGSWFWVNNDTLGNLVSVPLCPMNPYRCGALKAGDKVLENRDCNEKLNFLCFY